jgi:GNAT superfamily N-acetyltransferase
VTGSGQIAAPEPLNADHILGEFDSGVAPLDEWLKRRATTNELTGASRTFVMTSGNRVLGYYSLAAASIAHLTSTPKARRNMPDPVPAVLIGRLALDRSLQGQGYGTSLLRDAVLRIAGAATTIGVRAILVHAISEEAKTFYVRFGFRPSPIEPMTLMITIDEVRNLIVR